MCERFTSHSRSEATQTARDSREVEGVIRKGSGRRRDLTLHLVYAASTRKDISMESQWLGLAWMDHEFFTEQATPTLHGLGLVCYSA